MSTAPPTPPSILDLTPDAARERLVDMGGRSQGCRPTAPSRSSGGSGCSRSAPGARRPSSRRRSATRLDAEFPLRLASTEVISELSQDGTRKFLWRLHDGEAIESVLIPSRQPAHPLHLLAGRVRAGLRLLRHRPDGVPPEPEPLRDRRPGARGRAPGPGRQADQHRLHGHGRAAAQLARRWTRRSPSSTTPKGSAIGARHITVSHGGHPAGDEEAGGAAGAVPAGHLAARPDGGAPARRSCRSRRSTTSKAVLEAAEAFRKRITFEYVLIAGKNDTDQDADALARAGPQLGALVNLLPLHPGGAPGLTPTPSNKIRDFAERLQARGRRGGGAAEPRARHQRGLRAAGGAAGQRGGGAVTAFHRKAAKQTRRAPLGHQQCRAQRRTDRFFCATASHRFAALTVCSYVLYVICIHLPSKPGSCPFLPLRNR